MTKVKKYCLVAAGFAISILLAVIGGFAWAKKRVVVIDDGIKPKKPTNFVRSLKEKKDAIDKQVSDLDPDSLADNINDEYE